MISGLKPGGYSEQKTLWWCAAPGSTHMYSYGDMGPILVKKSLEEGPISQKLRKMVKSAIFVVEKPFEKQNKTKQKQNKKQQQQQQNVESAVFEGEKLYM